MDAGLLLRVSQDTILLALEVAAPVLLAVLVVSALVSVLQATTQMQDPTAATVPRLAAAAVAVLIFGLWMLSALRAFTVDLWANLPQMVR
ncbi:MAG: flagellar biosynthetic protein FliQ [Armatimonadota bacterium]